MSKRKAQALHGETSFEALVAAAAEVSDAAREAGGAGATPSRAHARGFAGKGPGKCR